MKKYLGFIAATVMLVEGFGAGAAIAGDKWGAVAIGPNGAYGYANNINTMEEAGQAALSQCGSNCRLKLLFTNACGAIATGIKGSFGYSYDPFEQAATDRAMGECSPCADQCRNENKCKIVASSCAAP